MGVKYLDDMQRFFSLLKVQRRAIPDHVKRNKESHLKLACERLKELQFSSTLTTANIEEVQTEMVSAMKKIKELSEVVLNSGGLQNLHDKIVVTNEKLQDLQSRKDANDTGLAALQDEVVAIKKEVKELSNVSSNGRFVELQDEVNKLQKIIPKIDSLQGLRGEVAGINKKLRKFQETMASLEKQFDSFQCLREQVAATNTKLQKLQEAISSLEDQNITIFRDCSVIDQIDEVKSELQRELQNVRENVHRDKMQREEALKNFTSWLAILVFLFLFLFSFAFVRKEEHQNLQQNFWASSAKLEQLHTYVVDRTRFLQDETQCKTEKFVWLFSDFNSRFLKAKSGAKLCFFSEPFFVEPYGYKMCISICPNGNPVQNTHLSVFVYFLRSNDDDSLPWPFQQKVTFILVDQQDDPTQRKNIEATIFPDKMPNSRASAAFAKPKKSSKMKTK